MEDLRTSYDWIVIGSGFGGSVSALRLAEKGYRVLVLEKGRRFAPRTSPRPTGTCALAVDARARHARHLPDDLPARTSPCSTAWAWAAARSSTPTRCPRRRTHSSRPVAGHTWPTGRASSSRTTRPRCACWARRAVPERDRSDRILARDRRGHRPAPSTSTPTDVASTSASPGVTVPDPYFGGEGPRAHRLHRVRRVHDRLPASAPRTRSTRTTCTSPRSAARQVQRRDGGHRGARARGGRLPRRDARARSAAQAPGRSRRKGDLRRRRDGHHPAAARR